MGFTMDKFTGDELTRNKELAEYICNNIIPISDNAVTDADIKRIVINVLSDDYEIENKDFSFVEMGNSREIWVCWTEDEHGIYEWWITGDDC
ncbi:hypothetical protein [Metabacillus endolithicus]|uniref:Uncharacterized protein n=1 Tax=Metabacillus endolithicus TaxID=1535204 RepID=A0ABW5C653_9BACI|nr:hypothetical protein [Metabacillus endolithicus]UPG66212.1 hypothetical protein MVE64_26245 [Metabacillus endolithicus]